MEYFNRFTVASAYYDIYNYPDRSNKNNMRKRYANAQFPIEYLQFHKSIYYTEFYIVWDFGGGMHKYHYIHTYSIPCRYYYSEYEININGIIYSDYWYKYGIRYKSIDYMRDKRIIKTFKNGYLYNEKIEITNN